MRRDNGAASVEVRQPEHVVPSAVIEVARRDPDVLLSAPDASDDLDEVFRAVLVPSRVVRALRHCLVVVDRDVAVVYRPERGGSLPLHARSDFPDGDDVHEHGTAFDRGGHKPRDVVSPSRRALVDELGRYDRLLEIGIGTRPGVARALADRGRDVVAIDVADVADAADGHSSESPGSLRFYRADIVALAAAPDPPSALADAIADGVTTDPTGFDAVYAINLPAELQRPTVTLARALGVTCLFTTLGFEQPVVAVEPKSLAGSTVFVVRPPDGDVQPTDHDVSPP